MEDSAADLLEAARQTYFVQRSRRPGIELAVSAGKRLRDPALLIESGRFLLREQQYDELNELAGWCADQEPVRGLGLALQGAVVVWKEGPTPEAADLFNRGAQQPGLTGYNQLNASIVASNARFLAPPAAPPPLPPFSSPMRGRKRVIVVAADEVYLDLFAENLAANIRRLAPKIGIHIHLYCREEGSWSRALEQQANPQSYLTGISLSGELTNLRQYYMIGRYIHLPRIMDLTGAGTVLLSDIDAMFLESPEAAFDLIETADIGIAEHKSYTFPWMNYRGNFSGFTDTEKSRAMLAAVSGFLSVLDPKAHVYATDQLALMQAFFAAGESGTRVADLREILHSRTVQATGGGGDPAGKQRRLAEAFEKQVRPR